MKKILLIGSQHGDELLGEKLIEYIQTKRPEMLKYISYKIGNPKAHNLNVRCIESDMNRSYNGGDSTYEEKQAYRIMKYIHKEKFDLVLDLHTTTCNEPPCLIVAKLNKTVNEFSNVSSISNTLIMTSDLAKRGLIGNCKQSIAIEVFKDSVDDKLLNDICGDIERFASIKKIYQIDGTLNKSEITKNEAMSLVNFEKSKFGFVPIMVGESSYQQTNDFYGFKAHEISNNKV